MQMMTFAKTLTLSAFALGIFALQASAQDDRIILIGGRSEAGLRLEEETFAEIKYRKAGRTLSVPGAKVLKIIHGDGPAEYRAGDGQRKGAQYNKAIRSYQKALKAKGNKPWVTLYANFYIGECYRLSGQPKDALSYYKKVTADAKHFLYPQAMIGLGLAQGDAQEYGKAVATLKTIADGRYGAWLPRANYALGVVNMKKGSMNDARRFFVRVQDQRDDPSMRMAGFVGQGQTYLREKDFNRAVNFFEKILRGRNVTPQVAAVARAGIGDCEFERAKKNKDENGYKKALVQYLRVIVQYSGTPEAYPRALYQAALIYDRFKLKESAEALRRELKSRCPTSEYCKKIS